MSAAKPGTVDFSSQGELAALQLRLLKEHLSYLSVNSPYYRERLNPGSFDIEQLTSLADLSSLPLTGKRELEEYNRDFLAVDEQEVIDVCQTSGTTGTPVTIWQTEADLQRLALNEQRAFLLAGVTANDRVLIGAALDRVFMAGLAYFLGLRKIGATIIRAGSGQPGLVAGLILRQQPNVLVGVPSLLKQLAHRFVAQGENPAALGVDTLICIGEPVRDADLSLSPLGQDLQRLWQAQVLGTYASTELSTAFTDCPEGRGGHLLPELVVVEIVDADGRPVSDGKTGEVVVTPLGIRGTPLLRYRTGDIAALHQDPCSCGRWTPRLGPIVGRLAQMMKVRGTTLFPGTVARALQELEGVQGYYLEVFSEYDLSDRLRVVVGTRDVTLTSEIVAERIAARARVRPEVVLVKPEQVLSKTILPEQRKPVTFFDYRQKPPQDGK